MASEARSRAGEKGGRGGGRAARERDACSCERAVRTWTIYLSIYLSTYLSFYLSAAGRRGRTGRKPRRPSKLTRAPPRLMERISARMLQSSAWMEGAAQLRA